MTFERAVAFILKLEGGYVFDSNDPGGETNMGISKRAYPHLEVSSLSRKEAEDIYRTDYWEPLKPLLLPPVLRLCLFDCAVNQGLSRAIRMLQGVCGATPDGIIGPQTISLANEIGDVDGLGALLMARLDHYKKLPQWSLYGGGWCKRLILIQTESFRGDA